MSIPQLHHTDGKPLHHWSRQLALRDRQVLIEAGAWLRQIDWQQFVTLTFTWNVRAETATEHFRRWINNIERTIQTRVCYVAGMERKSHSHGMEVPWHFHALLTSLLPIPSGLLKTTWESQTGHHAQGLASGVDVPALIEPYDVGKLGIEYCLKSINTDNGEWIFRWLELFLPNQKQTSFPNGRTIQQRRRFQKQAQAAKRRTTILLPHTQRSSSAGTKDCSQEL